jgi:choline monooxygenase
MTDRGRKILEGFDPTLPLERAHTIPSEWYFDPDIHEMERRAAFHGSWQLVGRIEQIASPGQYITADIAGEPVLVLRGSDGTLRAMSNVCRHRGSPLCSDPHGTASRLRCPYHGWTYDLAGRLIGTPEFDGVQDFSRDESGLPRFEVAEWGPFLFVHVLPATLSLRQSLAPLPDYEQVLQLPSLRFVHRKEYVLECNWKVFVDNYLDGGYHVNSVHPGLAGVLDYSRYRTELADRTNVQISPIKQPASGDNDTAAAVRQGDNAYYWWIFPNLMINCYSGVMDTNLVLPMGPQRCRVIFDFYFSHSEGPEAAAYIEESIRVADQIQAEDVDICEKVQRGLRSRTYRTGRFSVRREGGGYHFHRLLAAELRAALTDS